MLSFATYGKFVVQKNGDDVIEG